MALISGGSEHSWTMEATSCPNSRISSLSVVSVSSIVSWRRAAWIVGRWVRELEVRRVATAWRGGEMRIGEGVRGG